MTVVSRDVFVSGATGYLGRALIPELIARGHKVRGLVRANSVEKLPRGAEVVIGDPLNAGTYLATLRPGETLVHLVGVPHPSPAKAAQFRSIDLASVLAAVQGARANGVAHFVYLSVSQPIPIMQAYVAARAEGEAAIVAAGLTATFLRPFYVIGPGHYWPLAVAPFLKLAEQFSSLRERASRLGLVSLKEMVGALVRAVEEPPENGQRVVDVASIRH